MSAASAKTAVEFASVYGPVRSWRYGRSLGIDPIGSVSTCSFDCVYCQLGAIERLSGDRQVFVPTARILKELNQFAPWDVDAITLSGSGEPTLALNLGEILTEIKTLTGKPTVVLTNGTLLCDPHVRAQLQQADRVALKIDGVSPQMQQRVNRPIACLDWDAIVSGIERFARDYNGRLEIQTMLLTAWHEADIAAYSETLTRLRPSEVQLNVPKRPKPVGRQLDGRGNHDGDRPYAVRQLKCLEPETIEAIAKAIEARTKIPIRYR